MVGLGGARCRQQLPPGLPIRGCLHSEVTEARRCERSALQACAVCPGLPPHDPLPLPGSHLRQLPATDAEWALNTRNLDVIQGKPI